MNGSIWFLIASTLNGFGSEPAANEPAPAPAKASKPAVVAKAPAPAPVPLPTPAAPVAAPAPAAPPASLTMGGVWALPLPAIAARETDADAAVGKVQEFYKNTQQMTAAFQQTYTNQTFGEPTHSKGAVWVKKPGKMRWDYYKGTGKSAAVEKSFISDGATLWAVDFDNKQVFKRDLEKNLLPVAVSFLYGKGDLRRDFVPALDTSGKWGSKSDLVLRLTPRKPSAQYKTLFLVVDPKSYEVKESVVIEASGNTNHFRFRNTDLKKQVDDKWFFFNQKDPKVKSFRYIDADKEQEKAK